MCLVGVAVADTPANCLFEDIRGTWTFYETERNGDNTLSCDTMGPIVYSKNFTFDFPNTAIDELGNQGTWTLVWNQGFEVSMLLQFYIYIFKN